MTSSSDPAVSAVTDLNEENSIWIEKAWQWFYYFLNALIFSIVAASIGIAIYVGVLLGLGGSASVFYSLHLLKHPEGFFAKLGDFLSSCYERLLLFAQDPAVVRWKVSLRA